MISDKRQLFDRKKNNWRIKLQATEFKKYKTWDPNIRLYIVIVFRCPMHIKFLRYRIFSSCVMHKKNYVHLILQIRSKANDVIKIAWTLSGFNFSAIGSLWRPLEAVLQPRHSDSVASPAKPRPLEAFKGQRWLKNWNHLKFRLFWSQY